MIQVIDDLLYGGIRYSIECDQCHRTADASVTKFEISEIHRDNRSGLSKLWAVWFKDWDHNGVIVRCPDCIAKACDRIADDLLVGGLRWH